MITLLQKFQDFQVVALQNQVLGRVKMNRLFRRGNQSSGAEGLNGADRLAFARPGQAVTLRAGRGGRAQKQRQAIDIQFALREGGGQEIKRRAVRVSAVTSAEVSGRRVSSWEWVRGHGLPTGEKRWFHYSAMPRPKFLLFIFIAARGRAAIRSRSARASAGRNVSSNCLWGFGRFDSG